MLVIAILANDSDTIVLGTAPDWTQQRVKLPGLLATNEARAERPAV